MSHTRDYENRAIETLASLGVLASIETVNTLVMLQQTARQEGMDKIVAVAKEHRDTIKNPIREPAFSRRTRSQPW